MPFQIEAYSEISNFLGRGGGIRGWGTHILKVSLSTSQNEETSKKDLTFPYIHISYAEPNLRYVVSIHNTDKSVLVIGRTPFRILNV